MTVRSAVATAGGLPGLVGAAVRAADGGRDLRLEGVAALTPVERLVLGSGGAPRPQALRGPEVLGGRGALPAAGSLGYLGEEMHESVFDNNNAEPERRFLGRHGPDGANPSP